MLYKRREFQVSLLGLMVAGTVFLLLGCGGGRNGLSAASPASFGDGGDVVGLAQRPLPMPHAVASSPVEPAKSTVSIKIVPNAEEEIKEGVKASLFLGHVDPKKPKKSKKSKKGNLTVTSNPTGATVSLDGENKGVTPLNLTGLNPGDHHVHLTKAGFADAHAPMVPVEKGKTTILHAELAALGPQGQDVNFTGIQTGNTLTPPTSGTTGGVAGILTDAQGGRIPGAMVSLVNATRKASLAKLSHAGTARTAYSDAEGVYSFGIVEPANYQLVIAGPPGWGYTERTESVSVNANQVTRKDAQLAGGPEVGAGDKWRGAKIWDEWRFYNTTNGLQPGAPSGQRCRACHGWQGQVALGNAPAKPVDRVNVRSAAQWSHLIRNHRPAVVGANTLDKPFSQIFVDVNVDGVGPLSAEQKIADLVAFLKDANSFIEFAFTPGDAARGQTLYQTTYGCIGCHGADGRDINFHKTTDTEQVRDVEYLGHIANNPNDPNGLELGHRVRFGHPRPDAQQRPIWSGLAMIAFKQVMNIPEQDIRDIRAYEFNFPKDPLPWGQGK